MKKGFTLIELMVVIVIIGILAAIAVPKMFGMSAKAKAAEVGPAVGSWSKITSAYITETSAVGTWISVGYIPPGGTVSSTTGATPNFSYADGINGVLTSGFSARNLVKLNNCAENATALTVSPVTKGTATANWSAAMGTDGVAVAKNPTTANCGELTPNFERLM